jgi:chromosome segregation ATPase
MDFQSIRQTIQKYRAKEIELSTTIKKLDQDFQEAHSKLKEIETKYPDLDDQIRSLEDELKANEAALTKALKEAEDLNATVPTSV